MAKEVAWMVVISLIVTTAVGSAVGLAMLGQTGNVYSNLGVSYVDVVGSGESLLITKDGAKFVNDTDWSAQTFTPLVNMNTTILSIKAYRVGTPGNLNLSVTTTSASKPTTTILATGNLTADDFTDATAGAFYNVTVNRAALTSGTEYALVATVPDGDVTNYVMWTSDGSSPAYTRGNQTTSANGGSTWSIVTATDQLFQVYDISAVITQAGSAYSGVSNIIYTSWPLLGLAVLGFIASAVLASVMIFR